MKKLILSAFFALTFLLSPVSGYAIFDIGVYGGYGFTQIPDAGATIDALSNPGAWDYGSVAHFNIKLFNILSMGLGLYYQGSYFTNFNFVKLVNDNVNFAIQSRDAVGFSVYVQLDIIKVFHPYVRVTLAIWERQNLSEIDASGFTGSPTTLDFFFKTWAVGPGFAFNLGIIDIFIDYMFNIAVAPDQPVSIGSLTEQMKASMSHTFHLGVRLNF